MVYLAQSVTIVNITRMWEAGRSTTIASFAETIDDYVYGKGKWKSDHGSNAATEIANHLQGLSASLD
jgi:hypothetical protein